MTDITATVVETAVPEPDGGVVRFDGPRGPLVGLLVKVFLLSLVTLGFYRFWGKTAVRRYFWRHVSIGGDRLEYTGRAVELLIGFLIAVVILAPLFMAPVIIAFLVGDPTVLGAFSTLQSLVVLLLIQVAIYRARRYRLTRTAWRGVHFGQDGSAFIYAMAVFGFGMLAGITLGLSYPWARVFLAHYRMTHTTFGRARFSFAAEGRKLFLSWLAVWVSAAGAVAAVVFVAVAAVVGGAAESGAALAGGVLVALGLVVVAVVAYARYRVREFRYFARATSLNGITFSSGLKTRRVIVIALVQLLLASAAVLVPIIAGVALGVGLGLAGHSVDETLIGLAVLPFSLAAVGLLFIVNIAWLRFELLKAICESLDVANLTAAEEIVQDPGAAPRYGEGMADAFDVGAF